MGTGFTPPLALKTASFTPSEGLKEGVLDSNRDCRSQSPRWISQIHEESAYFSQFEFKIGSFTPSRRTEGGTFQLQDRIRTVTVLSNVRAVILKNLMNIPARVAV